MRITYPIIGNDKGAMDVTAHHSGQQRVGRRNTLLLLSVAACGNLFFDRALWVIYLSERGLSLLQIGILESILQVTMLLFEIPTGILADLVGRKVSVIIGRGLLTAYLVGMTLSHSMLTTAVSFVLLGLGITFISGAEVALLYDSFALTDRAADGSFTKVVGLYNAVITVSLAVAMMIGGALRLVSWAAVFGTAAAFQLLAMVTSFYLVEKPLAGGPERRPLLTHHLRGICMFMWENRRIAALMGGIALYSGFVSTYYILTQSILSGMGLTAAVVAVAFGIESLVSAAVAAKAHVIETRFGGKRVILGAVIVSALGFSVVNARYHLTSLVALFTISPVANLLYPIAENAINRGIPSDMRATLLSMLNFSSALLMAILFPVMGYAGDRLELNVAVGTGGVLCMFVCIGCISRFLTIPQDRLTQGSRRQ